MSGFILRMTASADLRHEVQSGCGSTRPPSESTTATGQPDFVSWASRSWWRVATSSSAGLS